MSPMMTRRRGGRRLDDSYLYDADAVQVGVLLFGQRVCTGCRLPLPACSDYFVQTKNGDGFVHLKSACKRCTAERYREADKQRKQRKSKRGEGGGAGARALREDGEDAGVERRGGAMTTLLYIFAFIGVWYCLSIATLLVLLGIAEWRREAQAAALRAAEAERWSGGTD